MFTVKTVRVSAVLGFSLVTSIVGIRVKGVEACVVSNTEDALVVTVVLELSLAVFFSVLKGPANLEKVGVVTSTVGAVVTLVVLGFSVVVSSVVGIVDDVETSLVSDIEEAVVVASVVGLSLVVAVVSIVMRLAVVEEGSVLVNAVATVEMFAVLGFSLVTSAVVGMV